MSFPGGSNGKESACGMGDLGSILGLGRSPGGGHGYLLQCSCLENSIERSLVSYSPWSCKELDMMSHFHFLFCIFQCPIHATHMYPHMHTHISSNFVGWGARQWISFLGFQRLYQKLFFQPRKVDPRSQRHWFLCLQNKEYLRDHLVSQHLTKLAGFNLSELENSWCHNERMFILPN